MKRAFLYRVRTRIALLFMAAVMSGCAGYNLVLDETKVLALDANHLAYHVVVKNAPQSGAFCKSERFYGYSVVQASLTNAPSLAQSTIVNGAGGGGPFGHAIPDDPNNAYLFRVLDVGETDTLTLYNVTLNNFDINATPYLIFELRSSTDRHYGPTMHTGTGQCCRYGETHVIDLRSWHNP
jgi:hypothetical protein